jgi:superfamily II DNA/RNA helicase
MSFSSFGLAPEVMQSINALGYSDPTPIQEKAISKIMIGKDVLGIAQTGTGKTGAFLIPIIHRLQPMANSSTSPARHPIRSIILAPTRELADQIYENAKSFTTSSFLRVGVVFGGVNINQQTDFLNKGVEILIATPGRLLDHIKQKNLRLDAVSVFTLDEADRMLDMGFLPDLQKIIEKLPKIRQSLLFSATFSEEIKKFSKKILDTDSELVQVSVSNSTAVTVDQIIYELANYEHKRKHLYELIKKNKSSQILIFTNTKNEASSLANYLHKSNLLTDSIHGNKTQGDRLKVLDSFKIGELRILVATDVAARGLDIPELPVVINFDVPFVAEDYIHRIGRTGRAGSSGIAISLMTFEDNDKVLEIEKLIKRKLKKEKIEFYKHRSSIEYSKKKNTDELIPTKYNMKPISVSGTSGKIKTGKKQVNLPILLTSQPAKDYQKKITFCEL